MIGRTRRVTPTPQALLSGGPGTLLAVSRRSVRQARDDRSEAGLPTPGLLEKYRPAAWHDRQTERQNKRPEMKYL